MSDTKISLAIFGNQNSNSGYQPLYWINDPPQQLENFVPPGMDENPYFFTLQVLPAHTQYTLIQNRVSSYMSSRPGVLKMAISIPKGYRISGGVSPMTVLIEVRKTFLDTCMTQRDAHIEAYNFKEKLADPDIFSTIVDAYQLEADTQPHLPMSGTDEMLMLLDDTAIAQLFIAPQKPEFTQFKRIIVANKGDVSIYKANAEATTIKNAEATTVKNAEATTVKNAETGTFKSEKKEMETVKATAQKPVPWKKYLPLVLFPLIIGGVVFWTRGSSTTSSAKFTNYDADKTEEEAILDAEVTEEEAILDTDKPKEGTILDDEMTEEEAMEQAIKEAYVITPEGSGDTLRSADKPHRQDTSSLHSHDNTKNMNHK